MNMPLPDSRHIPVWQDVDILVAGATIAAVSAAVSAARTGCRVALVADEMYPGQDLAGALRLWAREAGGDPWLASAYAGCDPASPAALKRSLEHALIEAGVLFLYGVRPIGLLHSQDGLLRGAVIAARTALFAITCRRMIDATPHGILARMAGVPIASRSGFSTDSRWRILADRQPAGWTGDCQPITPGYRQVLKDGPRDYEAFELGIGADTLGADPRASEHLARALLVDESVWVTADALIAESRDVLAGHPLVSSLTALPESSLQPAPGLWLANGLVPVSSPGLPAQPDLLSSLGRRVGELAAGGLPGSIPAVRGALRLSTGGDAAEAGGFAEAFLRDSGSTLEVTGWKFPEWENFDVVVAGGGTGGAPAAIAAARSGARTLCLEMAHGFGGVGTLGLISSYWFGNLVGFTSELNALVSGFDAISRAKNGKMWHPGVKSGLYHRLLRDAGGTAWLGSFLCGVRMRGNRPEGVLVSTPFGCGFVRARSFVDATGNADLAAAAGARCRVLDARHAAVQGTGISPRLSPSVAHKNADHTFIDDNDPVGITAAHVQARAKYPDDFDTMPFVNSRERRQIEGEFEVSPLDILAGRTFPDTVFTASSNFDTHGFIVHPVFMVAPPDHKPLQAHVPLRCMIPRGLERVLVTGLGMSAHRDAIPVIRMQADVQNQGYAAGILAARTAESGQNLRDIDVGAFQQELVAQGIISPETAAHGDSFPLSPDAVAEAASGDLGSAKNVAILFAHPAAARAHLSAVLHGDGDDCRKESAALILGLMGAPEAAGTLYDLLASTAWDEGWNYRGMGQFGESMSRADAQIIALGRCGTEEMAGPLVRLAAELDGDAAFSHCRALALAAAGLKSPELTGAIAGLLDRPGISGHAFDSIEALLTDTDGDPTSTRFRNLALRELYLARGLFLAGDLAGRGRSLLESYTRDLRGHFARHAAAVLATPSDKGDNPMELA